jgi:hypothetical protein
MESLRCVTNYLLILIHIYVGWGAQNFYSHKGSLRLKEFRNQSFEAQGLLYKICTTSFNSKKLHCAQTIFLWITHVS